MQKSNNNNTSPRRPYVVPLVSRLEESRTPERHNSASADGSVRSTMSRGTSRARVSLARCALACALALATSTRARGEFVVTTDEIALASRASSAPLRGLTLTDMIAKHVAFPREVRPTLDRRALRDSGGRGRARDAQLRLRRTDHLYASIGQALARNVRDAYDGDDACSSLEGPTCAALGASDKRATDGDDADATALKATSVRRSRVSLVRLDDVNDLVKYFTKHANGDVRGALSIAMEENAGELRERLSELTQAAATSFAKAQASATTSDAKHAQDDVSDDAGPATSPISGFTGGPFDGSSKSVPGLAKRIAIFYNARPTAVSLYWVDFDGNEVHYVDVHPQHQGIVKTFQMHIWIVREMDSSRFVAQYTVGDEDTSTQSFTIPTS